MDFPDDDAGLFDQLIACIYIKTFDMKMFGDEMSNCEREVQAAQLFALAEKYDVEAVMLNICVKLHAHGRNYKTGYINYVQRFDPPDRRAVEIAYKYTHRDSILRMVFVDWYSMCNVRKDKGVRDWLPTVPEFASDLVVTTSREQMCFDKDAMSYLVRLKSAKIDD